MGRTEPVQSALDKKVQNDAESEPDSDMPTDA